MSIDTNNVSVSRTSSDEVAPSGGTTSPVNFGTAGNGDGGISGTHGRGDKPSVLERVSRGFRDLFSRPAAVVSGGVTQVAKTFGVSRKVAGIGVAIAALALGGGTVAVVGASFGANNEYLQTIWVDDDECVDYISEAKKELGGGEIEVPESIVGSDGKTYKVGYVGSWEGRVGPLRGLGLCGDVLKMADFYDANGGHTDSAGFERIGELYIVAVGQGPFVAKGQNATHVGDLLTLTFDDGTSIGALVGDMKGRYGVPDPYDPSTFNVIVTGTDPQGRPDTSCGWGHAYGDQVHVLEFWGYGDSGDPMSGPIQQSTGGSMRRIASVTNHGMAAEFAAFPPTSGSVDGALVSMKSLSTSKAASAVAECETHGNFDNSTLAAALISYSYSQKRYQPDSEPSTALYQEVCEAVLGTDDCTYGMHYHSCDRGVAAAVRWTGADINFPAGACDSQYTYLKESPLWEEVTHGDVPIGGDDDWAASIGLEPGDVGVSYGEHTLAYVGNEAVLEGYENFIKGNDGQVPGTGGDIGEPTPGSAWVMASYGERGAGIQNMSDSRPYAFFRYVGDYPDADKYSNVGTSATINGTTSHGTSCDCGEEPEECNNSGAAEIIAQVAERIGADDSHGYSQPARLGNGVVQTLKLDHETVKVHGGDYDCSSLASQCVIAAGLLPEGQVFWTGDEDEMLTGAGFTRMDFSPGSVKRGDILWHEGHTGIALGNGMQCDAHGDENGGLGEGAMEGDQTAYEISTTELWSDYWTYMYRPPSTGGNAKCSDDKISGKGSLTDAQRKQIVDFAITQIGVPYNYGPGGGTGGSWDNDVPNQQLSCNGLTYWSYHAAGVEIPRGSREQQAGAPVVTSTGSVADMAPGDIVCWDDTGRRDDISGYLITYQHVAIYIGNGEIVEGTMPCAQRRHIVDGEYSYSITW